MIVKELFAKLGLDVDLSGFSKADTLVGGLKAGFAALGGVVAAAAAGVGAMVLHTVEAADHLDETAQSAGLNVEALQELAYAAGFSGMNVDALAGGLTKLTRNMSAAKGGAEEQAKAFAAVGVKVTDANGSLRDSGDVLEDLAEHFAALPDGADKTAAAISVFGKSGAQMIPFLNAGRDGIAALRAEAHELGVVLDESTVKEGAEVADALDRLKAGALGLQYSIAGPLLGTVKEYIEGLRKWIASNKELTKQRVEKVVGLVKGALAVLLPVLRFVLSVLGGIVDNWKLLAVLLTSVVLGAIVVNSTAVFALAQAYIAAGAAGVWAAIKTGAAWAIANLPLIAMAAIFAVIILLMEDISVALKGGDSLLKSWLADWNDDKPDDPWWLRDIKALAYLMLHFGPIFDFWKGQFGEFWDYLTEGFSKTFKDITRGFKRVFHITDDTDTSASPFENATNGFKDGEGHGAGEWKRTGASGELRFFPFGAGASPEAGAGGAGGGGAGGGGAGGASSTFEATIVVNPPAGASSSEVASQAVSQFDDWHQGKLAEANASF